MSLLQDAMKSAGKAFFDSFGEEIDYDGMKILAIPEIGNTWQKGGPVTSEGVTGSAFFSVWAKDVPDPSPDDLIIYEGKTYDFLRIVETDQVIHKIECTFNESGIFGR